MQLALAGIFIFAKEIQGSSDTPRNRPNCFASNLFVPTPQNLATFRGLEKHQTLTVAYPIKKKR